MRGEPAHCQDNRRFLLRARRSRAYASSRVPRHLALSTGAAMRRFRRVSILLLLLLGASVPCQVAGQPHGTLGGAGTGFAAPASGPDRVIVAWFGQPASVSEVRARAWTADGDLVAGWPAEGVLVTVGALSSNYLAVAEDG